MQPPYGAISRCDKALVNAGTRIRLTDHNYSSAVHLERDRIKRECPERSDAEIDQVIFSAILDLLGDPRWEGVQ
jgi:hypothetical protein